MGVKNFQENFEKKLGVRGPIALGGGVRGTEGNLIFLQASGLSEKTVSRTVSWLCHLHSHSDALCPSGALMSPS